MPDTYRLCHEPIRKIVIAGGGASGWMAAAAVARMIERGRVSVTLIESDDTSAVGFAEAATPAVRSFYERLELKENDLLRHTQGSFRLGTEFVDWHSRGTRYMHSSGIHGTDVEGFQFHHFWLKLHQLREADIGELSDYNLCTAAARLSRFTRPTAGGGAVLANLRYAFHLDAGLHAGYLRKYCEARGVRRLAGKIADVKLSPVNGFITGLVLQDARVVEGDLFLDCSGLRGQLAQALSGGFEDWSRWLPCDRAVVASCERAGPLRPYARSIADVAGWRWQIPLQHLTGNGYVYCSEFSSEGTAQARLIFRLDAAAPPDTRLLKFTAGHRRRFWEKNCVAIGPAGGFIEPLQATGMHLIQAGIERLLALFPDRSFCAAAISAYNRYMADQYRRIRDFVLLHYKLTERADTPFWRHCSAISIPESLQEKIELFRGNATVLHDCEDPFTEHDWIAVMLGQGVRPAGYDPLVDCLPVENLRRLVRHSRDAIASTVAAMPVHESFVEQTCGDPQPSPPAGVSDSYC